MNQHTATSNNRALPHPCASVSFSSILLSFFLFLFRWLFGRWRWCDDWHGGALFATRTKFVCQRSLGCPKQSQPLADCPQQQRVRRYPLRKGAINVLPCLIPAPKPNRLPCFADRTVRALERRDGCYLHVVRPYRVGRVCYEFLSDGGDREKCKCE